MDLVVCSPQLDVEMLHSAVLRGIVERLLENPEQTQGQVGRQLAWDVVRRERDLDTGLLRELVAEAPGRRRQAEQFELGGVQRVCESLDVCGNVPGLILQ